MQTVFIHHAGGMGFERRESIVRRHRAILQQFKHVLDRMF